MHCRPAAIDTYDERYLTGNRKMIQQMGHEMRNTIRIKALWTLFIFDCYLAGEPTSRRPTGCRCGDTHT
jgi:hypothetical protein